MTQLHSECEEHMKMQHAEVPSSQVPWCRVRKYHAFNIYTMQESPNLWHPICQSHIEGSDARGTLR